MVTKEAALLRQLYRALILTKSDSEKDGFKYGDQSICVKALKAYEKWDASQMAEEPW